MVKCDNCPCAYFRESEVSDFFWWECVLEGDGNQLNDKNGHLFVSDGRCPLKRIELKDGTTFEPEVVDDNNM